MTRRYRIEVETPTGQFVEVEVRFRFALGEWAYRECEEAARGLFPACTFVNCEPLPDER